jgi:2-polyprenyl-6-methoxyphenol hydroxylase-like FAD-dependent oxidoreductase
MKIIILGAGIGGLTTAIALKNAGLNCEIYEAAEKFRPVGAGLSIALNAWKALESLGIDKEVEKKGYHYSFGKMLSAKGKTLQTLEMDDLRKTYHSNAVTIHRYDLHSILAENIGDNKVHFNKKCTDIKQSGNQIHLSFSDGSTAGCDYLIAADGIRSIVRKKFIPEAEERYSGQTCWRGICNTKIPDHDYSVLSETWGLGLRFGIVPLSEQSIYWFAVKDSDKVENHWVHKTNTELADMFSGFHKPVSEIIRNTPVESIFWNNLTDLKPIKKFAFQNVLLLGDAAHATTPNLGQGACMAIEDAAVLGSILKKEKDLVKAFELFEKRRIERTTKIVATSYQLGKIAQTRNPVLAGIRNIIFPLLPKSSNEKFFRFLFDIEFKA